LKPGFFNFCKKYKHAWVFSYLIIYAIWFFYLEIRDVPTFRLIHTTLDDFIPFDEWFIIPYFLWFIYVPVVVVYLMFKNKNEFYKICGFLFSGMTICLIIYTFWPNGQMLRLTEYPNDHFLTRLVISLQQLDTPLNVCPSIHVYNSVGTHIAVSRMELARKHPTLKSASFVLCTSICLSTMFLKQHSAFDVLCAFLLSILVYHIIYTEQYSTLKSKAKIFIKEKVLAKTSVFAKTSSD